MGHAAGRGQSVRGTYNFGIDGKAIPFGTNIVRAFADQEYEFYSHRSFQTAPHLTLTYGIALRHLPATFRENGVQVVPVTPLSQFFADRVGGQGRWNSQLRAAHGADHLRHPAGP